MDAGTYLSEVRPWGNTPPCGLMGGRAWWQASLLRRGGGCPLKPKLTSGGLISYRETSRGAASPHHPFDKNNYQLGSGESTRKVSRVSRVQVNQALVGQKRDRQQDNRHLGGPDHTLLSNTPHMTQTILASPSSVILLGSGL